MAPLELVNSIWLVVIILSVLVVVHEFGHFITARAFGVKVHEFSVGFGPVLWKHQGKETQYSIRWILAGGYCKIAGMDMAVEGETPEDTLPLKNTFMGLSLWQKIVVIGAGPICNLLLSFILYYILLTTIGMPGASNISFKPIVGDVTLGTPAYHAGLKTGDKILAINNKPISTSDDITQSIQKFDKTHPLEFKINHQGHSFIKSITPQFNSQVNRYTIGIVFKEPIYNQIFKKSTPGEAIWKTLALPRDTINAIIFIIKKKIRGFVGPIGMVDEVRKSLSLPPMLLVWYLIYLTVSISFSLCLLNLLPLPLPLLDGGWIVILILERLLRREFSSEQKAMAQMVGLVAFIVLALVIGYQDILHFGK